MPAGGKLYTAKNGAKYRKNARGQVRFVSGASPAYLAKIRKKRGKGKGKGKKKGKAKGGSLAGNVREFNARIDHGGLPPKRWKKGGGLGKKAAANIGFGAAGLALGAASGAIVGRGSTVSSSRQLAKGTRQGIKAIRKGGFVNSKYLAPAQRKRRVRGGGLSIHNQATVKFKAPGLRSKTSMGF